MYFPFAMTENVPPCSEIPKSYVSLLWQSETQVHMTYALAPKYFTPHWGATWGEWSVTSVALFNAACEGTQHEKYFQQPNSYLMWSGAYMPCSVHSQIWRFVPCETLDVISKEHRRNLSLRIGHVMPNWWRQILTLTDHIGILGSISNSWA